VPDSKDKRIKRLTLSDTARALETEITGYQIQLLEKAFAAVGDEAKESWLRVMRTLVQQTS
jgi:DNA-binding MarR family transcriptional regulator